MSLTDKFICTCNSYIYHNKVKVLIHYEKINYMDRQLFAKLHHEISVSLESTFSNWASSRFSKWVCSSSKLEITNLLFLFLGAHLYKISLRENSRIRNFSGPLFPKFKLIKSRCGKKRTKTTPHTDIVYVVYMKVGVQKSRSFSYLILWTGAWEYFLLILDTNCGLTWKLAKSVALNVMSLLLYSYWNFETFFIFYLFWFYSFQKAKWGQK